MLRARPCCLLGAGASDERLFSVHRHSRKQSEHTHRQSYGVASQSTGPNQTWPPRCMSPLTKALSNLSLSGLSVGPFIFLFGRYRKEHPLKSGSRHLLCSRWMTRIFSLRGLVGYQLFKVALSVYSRIRDVCTGRMLIIQQ